MLVTALATLPISPDTVIVDGYNSPGDGGGGTFFYDSGLTSFDDGIHFQSSIAPGGWSRIHSGAINIRWFGAYGDGSADNATVIMSALAYGTTILLPMGPEGGEYAVSTMEFPTEMMVRFEAGARILILSGETVRWASAIDASSDQWIFDCIDNPTNYTIDGLPRTDIPLVFYWKYFPTPIPPPPPPIPNPAIPEELSKPLTSKISVKWFGATGAGFTDNLINDPTNYASNTIQNGSYVNDTKAIRFALTAIGMALETNPAESFAFSGPNTLYFPKGCYAIDEPLYVSGGTFLEGDGATPNGGTTVFNINPSNYLLVLQSRGIGGTGGGGSAHILRNMVLTTRPTSVINSASSVIIFEDNRFNLDSRFYNLRFSNSPVGGATILVDDKNARYNIPDGEGTNAGLAVSLHIYDSMIDVIEGDFIRIGDEGAAIIRMYNCQFFDVYDCVIRNPAKVIVIPEMPRSIFEFRNCNFEGCGVVNINTPVPFVYSNDPNAEYYFSNCLFTTQDIETRFSGGRMKIDKAFTVSITNCSFYYRNSNKPHNLSYFLHIEGRVDNFIVSNNQIYKENEHAYAIMQFYSGFECYNFFVSNNVFKADHGVCIYNDDPSWHIDNGLMSNNLFGEISGGGNAIVGYFNPGLVLSNNSFKSPQDFRPIAQTNYGMKGTTAYHHNGPPATGNYYRGDRVVNVNPTGVAEPNSWVCITDGYPGVWIEDVIVSNLTKVKAFGKIRDVIGGSVQLDDAYNISQFVRISAGLYELTFASWQGNSPIVTVTALSDPWINTSLGFFIVTVNPPGGSPIYIRCSDVNGNPIDNSLCFIVQ